MRWYCLLLALAYNCCGAQGMTKKRVGALQRSAAVLGACNAAGFGISLATGSHLHLDLIGTGSFCLSAIATGGSTLRQRLSTMFVSIWASRLASFLFYRATITGHDARLDDQLATPGGAASFWFISFLWGWITMLPHNLGATIKPRVPLGPGAALASTAFGIGFAFESIADIQKFFYKQKYPSTFCDSGLWQLSQHPNYFGNLLLWSGLWLLNAPGLTLPQLAATSASPLFLATLFIGQSTGAITNAVQLADAKYGHDPRWSLYKERTPLLVPSLDTFFSKK